VWRFDGRWHLSRRNGLILSQRDRLIVARHEVPGQRCREAPSRRDVRSRGQSHRYLSSKLSPGMSKRQRVECSCRMPLQKRQVFPLKSSGPMMFDLILDGMNGFWQLRDAHTRFVWPFHPRMARAVPSAAPTFSKCPNCKRRLKAGAQFESTQADSRHRSPSSALGLKFPSGYGVGLTWESGPWRSGKLLVFSTWTPALCSPLNGVTTLGLPPAFSASFGELNHRPK
jgi:hypothetical protein